MQLLLLLLVLLLLLLVLMIDVASSVGRLKDVTRHFDGVLCSGSGHNVRLTDLKILKYFCC
jgi:hypothetical protein